jgi:GNAT superfamily N-acetyltransferase
LQPRQATAADVPAVIPTITEAFHADPTWSWAFPDPEQRPSQYRSWWALFVEGALPHGWVWMTPNCESASVWIPPGCAEMPEQLEEKVPGLLERLLGSHAASVLEALDRFDAAHPHTEPHDYRSLVGTRPRYRGRGIGMQLLADVLARIDAERMPAYLEASNAVNVPLYERLGFERFGEFPLPADGPTVVTMWREARED